MLICIPDVLTPDEVKACRALLEAGDWVDGNATSGAQAARAKKNEQLKEGSAAAAKVGDVILAALAANPLFLSAALPEKIFPPLFNRYSGGQNFGTHVDNAIRRIPGTPIKMRTDLSATLFFAGADEYEGGELVIETQYGAQEVKLDAGSMVLYPSTSLHHVKPVTKGTRLCSFFWLQSMVRDGAERELLFDLDQSVQDLAAEKGLDDPTTVRLTGIYHNLVRRWAGV
ncbi:Fe2+-dependent dioxygenase [Gimibacter soli]|uniref:Fe2+-dependent dioxygenase n=1 Tax=Gimibacter soli TaxID=3024400 RepID=A0AAE9XME4_9PROT|nr:Fe2+-dependent dioxygenase [Gimibacter soli]WCL53622.1 Fe2+-dependent dioxygenase [Gimibacter soli]